MRVAVAFQGTAVDFEVDEDRLAGAWDGPGGVVGEGVGSLVREAMESPRQFPALRLAVVPGDRVVIPIDPDVPEPGPILAALCGVLRRGRGRAGRHPGPGHRADAGARRAGRGRLRRARPGGPRAGSPISPTTSRDRRVYLNRLLTDADLVVPVGLLGPDPVLGHRGPWGVIYPGLADAEAARAFRALAGDEPASPGRRAAGAGGVGRGELAAGRPVPRRDRAGGRRAWRGSSPGRRRPSATEGIAAVDSAWTFRAEDRADLVVAGIGAPGRPTTLDDLAKGLAAASKVVRRGGKVVALSRADGSIGPALGRLIAADDPRSGPSALRGAEGEADYPAARLLAGALAWADIYLASALPESEVEDLAMIPLARPEEARRLVAASPSCLFLGQADRTLAAWSLDEDD